MKLPSFVCGFVAAGVAVFTFSVDAIEPAETVEIWSNLAPGERTRKTGDKLPPRESDQKPITRVENITLPTLDIYPVADPEKASGAGVLRLLKRALEMPLSDFLELSAAYQTLLHQSEDHQEALEAFFEKREGKYRGK